ncbi:hypothetical protein E4U21_007869 [Claviceps maximensis]|nr:hypothetical protein E4U21_007869 [Claviceps maximensis]
MRIGQVHAGHQVYRSPIASYPQKDALWATRFELNALSSPEDEKILQDLVALQPRPRQCNPPGIPRAGDKSRLHIWPRKSDWRRAEAQGDLDVIATL